MTRTTRAAVAVALGVVTPSVAVGQLNATVVGSGAVQPGRGRRACPAARPCTWSSRAAKSAL